MLSFDTTDAMDLVLQRELEVAFLKYQYAAESEKAGACAAYHRQLDAFAARVLR